MKLHRNASLVVALGTLALVAHVSLAAASVDFRDWKDSSFRALCDEASRAKRPVVLIVTQPDWCPPCIKLDRHWLKNPADTEVRALTKDALVLEVRGYEESGARLLRREALSFQGTPTLFVFAPPQLKKPLGQATLLGSIVGAPDDFPARLKAILATQGDPLARARAAVNSTADDVAKAGALLELASAQAGRGDAAAAESTLARVLELKGSPGTEAELNALRRKAEWQAAATITLRVRKDWKRALEQIDAYGAAVPLPDAEKEDFAYARAWALAHLGRRDEAIKQLDAGLPATVDGVDTFLYFCFRSDDARLWTLGEQRAQDAIKKFGDAEPALWQGLGRIQRRLGKLDDVSRSFERAVALSPVGEARETYEGQLETVRAELAEAKTASKDRAPKR